jgi:hypothetical protein
MYFKVYYFCFWILTLRVDSYRLVAVGHRQSIEASSTYATWFNQFNRTDLYQIQSYETTIIAFGELTGLTSAFIGTRGQAARAQSETIQNAFSVLAKSYEKQI